MNKLMGQIKNENKSNQKDLQKIDDLIYTTSTHEQTMKGIEKNVKCVKEHIHTSKLCSKNPLLILS